MNNSNINYIESQQHFEKIPNREENEIMLISRDMIRRVVKVILIAAIIQTILALIGFKFIGWPAAGFFAFLVLVMVIMKIPSVRIIRPATGLEFLMTKNAAAVIFPNYSIVAASLDTVLKTLFLEKGFKAPMTFVLLGTIGGMLLNVMTGLFTGGIVLSITNIRYTFKIKNKIEFQNRYCEIS